LNLERKIKDLEKKLQPWSDSSTAAESLSEIWDEDEKEEVRRLQRIEEIEEQANNARIARCEAKMAEVGEERFMKMIHHWDGESWSDYEGRTPIEEEYWRLSAEQYAIDWYRKLGKPYRMEDDSSARF
jgi:hypothetical protein